MVAFGSDWNVIWYVKTLCRSLIGDCSGYDDLIYVVVAVHDETLCMSSAAVASKLLACCLAMF